MLVFTKKLNCFLSFSKSVFFEPETLTVLIIKKPSFSKGLGQPKAFCDYDTSKPPFMTKFDRPDFDFSAIRPTIPGE